MGAAFEPSSAAAIAPAADPMRAIGPEGTPGTPAYVYDTEIVTHRLDALDAAFAGRLEISYAVKANPNARLLAVLGARIGHFDVSSIGEADRVFAGVPGARMSFTGPGKRLDELRRFAGLGVGHVVVESLDEAEDLSRLVRTERLPRQQVLVRINPREAPRGFGSAMGGRSSQFGVDEDALDDALLRLAALPGVELVGFHCFPAANGLDADSVGENLAGMAGLFSAAADRAGIRPSLVVFGAGFGIPYFDGERELDLGRVAAIANPSLDALRASPAFAATRFLLELGRWIVGPAGYLLTTVLRAKTGREGGFRICDAGFNAHMAACGMLGGPFRRNWPVRNLTNPDGRPQPVELVGPLCTSLDRIATGIVLPEVRKGDVLAILQSGAYGPTASPGRFISHPDVREFLLHEGELVDAGDSQPLAARLARPS